MDTMHTFCINCCQVQIYSMHSTHLWIHFWDLTGSFWLSAIIDTVHKTPCEHAYARTHTHMHMHTHTHASTQCYIKLTEQTSDWQREHTTAHSLQVTCGQEHLRHSECICSIIHTHTCMHAHTCTHMDTCMYARTCTHMNTCTYTQSDSLSLSPYESVLVTFLWGVTRFTRWWEARALSASESSQSNCEGRVPRVSQFRFHTHTPNEPPQDNHNMKQVQPYAYLHT